MLDRFMANVLCEFNGGWIAALCFAGAVNGMGGRIGLDDIGCAVVALTISGWWTAWRMSE